MNIRTATSKDLDGICKLSNEINEYHHLHMPHMFRKPGSLDQDIPYWSHYLEHEKGVIFVAEVSPDITGAICAEIIMSTPAPFFVDRCMCFIGTIVVSKKYQKTGTGKSLMSKIEEWAVTEGAEEIDLNVMRFNSNAFEFYKKSGFEAVFTRMAKKI